MLARFDYRALRSEKSTFFRLYRALAFSFLQVECFVAIFGFSLPIFVLLVGFYFIFLFRLGERSLISSFYL